MVWARIDDAILDNPKIAAAGIYGFALHVAAITWCCRNLTDGFIPTARVTALLSCDRVRFDAANPLALIDGARSAEVDEGLALLVVADHLVEVGLWELAPGGYRLHDFLAYNPAKSEVLRDRTAANERQARTRARRQSQRESPPESQRESRRDSRVTSRVNSRHPGPDPDPDPQREDPERARERAAPTLPAVWFTLEGWEPSEALIAEAAIEGVPRPVFDQRLADLRTGPIGGKRGVLDRDGYVRAQFPKWRLWAEQERARALAGGPRSAPAGALWEPNDQHRAYADRHALPLAELAAAYRKTGDPEQRSRKDADETFARRLVRAARDSGRDGTRDSRRDSRRDDPRDSRRDDPRDSRVTQGAPGAEEAVA